MKQRILTQIEVIQESDAQVFKQRVNDRLREIGNVLELTFPNDKGFCAMIKYEFKEIEPEDAAERYYLKHGKSYCCNDCPYLELDPDRRSITHWCNLHEDRVRLKHHCCNEFYDGLMDGSIHLVTPDERNKQFQEMDQYEMERRKKFRYEMQQASKYKRELLQADKERIEMLRNSSAAENEKRLFSARS